MIGRLILGALTLLLLPFLMPVLRLLWWAQSLIPDHLLWDWINRHPEATIRFLMWAVPICLVVGFVGIVALVASADPPPIPDHRRQPWRDWEDWERQEKARKERQQRLWRRLSQL